MPILPGLMAILLLSGTIVTPAEQAEVPPVPPVPTFEVAMTAYNAVPEQTDGDPFVTASGAYSNPEVVAARSRDLKDELPFGTIIEIDGPTDKQNSCGFDVVSPIMGYRVIADTMHQRFTKRIDVLFDTDANYIMRNGTTLNASKIFGICNGMTIRVVGKLDPAKMHKLPKTQAELARLVSNGDASVALN
jgi:3D (Asp-Asp-Asp) domain-containing protein